MLGEIVVSDPLTSAFSGTILEVSSRTAGV